MIIMILLIMRMLIVVLAMIIMIVMAMTTTRMIDVVMTMMLSGTHLTQIFLGLSAACTLPRLKYQIQQNIASPFSIPIVIIITSPCKHYLMWPTLFYSYFNFDAL